MVTRRYYTLVLLGKLLKRWMVARVASVLLTWQAAATAERLSTCTAHHGQDATRLHDELAAAMDRIDVLERSKPCKS